VTYKTNNEFPREAKMQTKTFLAVAGLLVGMAKANTASTTNTSAVSHGRLLL